MALRLPFSNVMEIVYHTDFSIGNQKILKIIKNVKMMIMRT